MASQIDVRHLKQSSNPRNSWDAFIQKIAGTDDKMPPSQKQALYKCLLVNVIAFCCLLFGAVFAYYASTSKSSNKYYTQMFFIIVPILVGLSIVLNLFQPTTKPTTLIFLLLSLIGLILASVYFLAYNSNNEYVNTIIKYALYIGIALIVIYAYKVTIKYLKNIHGWIGFFIKLLFFIPCLLYDLFQYIYVQVIVTINPALKTAYTDILASSAFSSSGTSTTSNVAKSTPFVNNKYEAWGVIGLIALGLVGWGGYKFYKYYRKQTVRSLVTKSIPLSRKTTIATNDVMTVPTNYSKKDIINPVQYSTSPDGAYNHNYSIDCWVFINTMQPEQIILKYGNDNSNIDGKPTIMTANNGAKRPFSLVFTNNYTVLDDAVFDFDMPLQKWNYLVITYDDNRVTMYLNSELVFSREIMKQNSSGVLTSNIPSYTMDDIIYTGSDNSKLYGSICNVNYYNTPLSLRDVTTNYKMLAHKDVPVDLL